MTERVLRWGLLSTARINRSLIPPLRSSKRNQLIGVASRRAETAEAYAREWKIPRAYSSYEAMLDDPEIDVIYNSLPNSLHALWTIRAAEAGKHVLCEKPLAVSVAEVDAIAEAAARAGVVVSEAFMYRHHLQTQKVVDLVREGALGRLHFIRGSFTFKISRSNDVRLDPYLGGGSIWDIGCYPISYARLLAGAEPLQVFGWRKDGASGVDESFAGQMRFPSDILAQFDSSFRQPFRAAVEVVGSEASLEIPVPFTPGKKEQLFLRRGDAVEKITIRGQALYLGEVEDMADAVLLGQPPRVSLADSRGNVASIVALLRSSDENLPVNVEQVLRNDSHAEHL